MPRVLSPTVFHPTLKFRFFVFSLQLPSAGMYARSAELPKATNAPVTVDYRGHYFKMKGKTRWNDITISCYQFEGFTNREMWSYFKDHYNVSGGHDEDHTRYKHVLVLTQLNPMGAPIGSWRLDGAFFSDIDTGDMDWGANDITECTLTITYDFAEYIGV